MQIHIPVLIKDLAPMSLLDNGLTFPPSFLSAYHYQCGCLPIEIITNPISESNKISGWQRLTYDHLHDRFFVFEHIVDWYDRNKTIGLNRYRIDYFHWEDRKWYRDNPSYLNWIDVRDLDRNRSIKILSFESGVITKPPQIKIEIEYKNGGKWEDIGFNIEDAFNKAYANMRKSLMTNRI